MQSKVIRIWNKLLFGKTMKFIVKCRQGNEFQSTEQ